jgi:hypothetical protein
MPKTEDIVNNLFLSIMHSICENFISIYGTQTFQEGTWKWGRTGEQVEFTALCKGQPDNGVNKNEHCLHLYGDPAANCDFKWNDCPCITLLKPICQKLKK